MKTRHMILGTVGLTAIATKAYSLVVRGALTLDSGIGRRERPLGPMEVRIEAAPETVFEVIAAPYLGKTPRALADKVRVVERGADMVLAEHFTAINKRRRATTLETVRFESPHRIMFRLVRGPVPEVTETFDLVESDNGTLFTYTGTLATDFWTLGRWWGSLVAEKWEDTVRVSVEGIKAEAERRVRLGLPGISVP